MNEIDSFLAFPKRMHNLYRVEIHEINNSHFMNTVSSSKSNRDLDIVPFGKRKQVPTPVQFNNACENSVQQKNQEPTHKQPCLRLCSKIPYGKVTFIPGLECTCYQEKSKNDHSEDKENQYHSLKQNAVCKGNQNVNISTHTEHKEKNESTVLYNVENNVRRSQRIKNKSICFEKSILINGGKRLANKINSTANMVYSVPSTENNGNYEVKSCENRMHDSDNKVPSPLQFKNASLQQKNQEPAHKQPCLGLCSKFQSEQPKNKNNLSSKNQIHISNSEDKENQYHPLKVCSKLNKQNAICKGNQNVNISVHSEHKEENEATVLYNVENNVRRSQRIKTKSICLEKSLVINGGKRLANKIHSTANMHCNFSSTDKNGHYKIKPCEKRIHDTDNKENQVDVDTELIKGCFNQGNLIPSVGLSKRTKQTRANNHASKTAKLDDKTSPQNPQLKNSRKNNKKLESGALNNKEDGLIHGTVQENWHTSDMNPRPSEGIHLKSGSREVKKAKRGTLKHLKERQTLFQHQQCNEEDMDIFESVERRNQNLSELFEFDLNDSLTIKTPKDKSKYKDVSSGMTPRSVLLSELGDRVKTPSSASTPLQKSSKAEQKHATELLYRHLKDKKPHRKTKVKGNSLMNASQSLKKFIQELPVLPEEQAQDRDSSFDDYFNDSS